MDTRFIKFWNVPASELLEQIQSTRNGLASNEAQERLIQFGSNLLKPKMRADKLTLFIAQFKSPIILILISAAILSSFLHDRADALIILSIVLVSGLLGFWQERSAANAVGRLLSIVQIKATVIR